MYAILNAISKFHGISVRKKLCTATCPGLLKTFTTKSHRNPKPFRHKRHLFEKPVIKLQEKLTQRTKQNFNYFVVLDFEATCDSPTNVDPPEIIEFPALKVNADTFEVESVFHSYVKPVMNPQLTPFCTELTGIIQSMIDGQSTFPVVFQNFLSWLENEEILKTGNTFALVACSDSDLDNLLPLQCIVSEIDVPDYMKKWINVKRSFCEIRPYTWPDNIKKMLQYCELDHKGDLHSGIDDATNLVRIMKDIAERGVVFNFNGQRKNE